LEDALYTDYEGAVLIANELARLVELKKIKLKHEIRFNLNEEEKKKIDDI